MMLIFVFLFQYNHYICYDFIFIDLFIIILGEWVVGIQYAFPAELYGRL